MTKCFFSVKYVTNNDCKVLRETKEGFILIIEDIP